MNDILEEIEDEQDLYNERDPNMPPLGSRVRRGRDWQWGDQDKFGPGTIVGHSKKGKLKTSDIDNNRISLIIMIRCDSVTYSYYI